jgi:Alpha 1,4-glycosyltransferase conserved region/Glycosyltransferase sugar-binding region containing DXD motif
MNDPVQSLWIGPRLSTLEQLSIQSFLDHGHQYHLYAYDEIAGVPSGAVVKDANEVIATTYIFQYRHRRSYAGFANVFRYKLLLERGGWWADTDVVCLRPLAFTDAYVFASEIVKWRDMSGAKALVTSCILRTPSGSDAMVRALRMCLDKDWAALSWGEIGPKLMGQVVEAHGLQRFVQPATAFCAIPYGEWQQLTEPEPPLLPSDVYAIHFWNEMWRLAGQDKDADYPPQCLYERLKRRHLHRTNMGSGGETSRGAGSPADIRESVALRGRAPT